MLTDLIGWVRNIAVPTWAEIGFDRQAERFHERLDFAGKPLAVPHRAMVQARQIFVFAQMAHTAPADPAGERAEGAMRSLLRDFSDTHGDETAIRFSIDANTGTPASELRDSYTHAFVLLAIAAMYRLNGNIALLDLADRILCFMDRRLTDHAHGGLFDALPAPSEKRQNPHMHLLEALLLLAKVAPQRDYLARAQPIVTLFQRHFLRDGLLFEYFRSDWTIESSRARWEPGHHLEWVWLLDEYDVLAGTDLRRETNELHAAVMAHGIAADGLLFDEMSADRTVTKASRRLWPHTEAIKAAAVRHRQDDGGAQPFADAMAGGLIGRFLDRPFTGGWIDQLDADDTALVDYVPASSLYHLALAAHVAAEGFAATPAPATD